MSTYVERLIEEERDLSDKWKRLYTFIGSDEFFSLSNTERLLLELQENIMFQYMTILTKRIQLIKE